MNKLQATAYAVMAISTLQTSANKENKLKDIKLTDIKNEMKTMFRVYRLKEVVEIADRTIKGKVNGNKRG